MDTKWFREGVSFEKMKEKLVSDEKETSKLESEHTSVLYFLYDGYHNAIKIGHDRRGENGILSRAKTHNLNPLFVIRSFELADLYRAKRGTALKDSIFSVAVWEKGLHDAFQAYHIQGEWFRYVGDLKKFVEGV